MTTWTTSCNISKWLVALPVAATCLLTLPVVTPASALTIKQKSSPPVHDQPITEMKQTPKGNGTRPDCPRDSHWDPNLKTCVPNGGHPVP